MRKVALFIFFGICLTWWAVLAGVTVVQHGRGTISRVITTTTTTTTTIPGNLIVNDSFESATGGIAVAWVYDSGYYYTGPGADAKMRFKGNLSPNPYGILEQSIPSATITGEMYRLILTIVDNNKAANAFIEPYMRGLASGIQLKNVGTFTNNICSGGQNLNFRLLGDDHNYQTGNYITVDNVYLFDLGKGNAVISGFVTFSAYNGTWRYAGNYGDAGNGYYPYFTNNVSGTLNYMYKYPGGAWSIYTTLGQFTSEREIPSAYWVPIGTWVFDIYPDYEEATGTMVAP